MYEILAERVRQNIESVKKHISFSANVRMMVNNKALRCNNAAGLCFDVGLLYQSAPTSIEWRIIDHCSAITRLYGVYEKFVEDLLTAHLQFIERNVAYTDLDDKFQTQHRRAVGQILIDLDRERYKSTIRFESVLDDIKNIFNGGTYRLLPEALLSHDQNLRMSELTTLFEKCGIPKVKEWIDGHRAIRRFLAENGQEDKAESKLGQLVQYRNDAAHGGIEVDDLLGTEALLEFANFVESLCAALTECVQWACLRKVRELGRIDRAGVIKERFSNGAVVAVVQENTFDLGASFYLVGEAFCYPAKICSIQDQGVSMASITVLDPKEIGFKFDIDPPRKADMYYWPERARS
ncbi:hypothetical protein V1286_005159 [Bradyrhizobium algeriense]|uniref:RiboL-PSP-HEPN domain-containing protein n=1 Tax=Bradyrhizobium algeriense TaxID=634784 RepID=A0ABU8BGM7_9BRAD